MKKKIAILHSEMIVGGSEKVLLNMLEALDYEQYDVTLFLPNEQGGFYSKIPKQVKIAFYSTKEEERSFFQIVSLHLKHRAFFDIVRLVYYRIMQRLHNHDWYWKTIYFYESLPKLSNDVYDGVFIYDDKSQRDIYFISHQLRYRKRISWIHNSFQEEVSQDYYIPKEYAQMDRIFCVSESVRKNVEKYFPFLKGRTEVFYNLLDTKEIEEKALEVPGILIEGDSLLSVGRLAPEKGHTIIPETMALLKENGYQGKWYIIGEGPMRSEIEKQISEWKVENEVILLGEEKNPYPYMRNCRIFVQTSLMEGYCTTTLEAKVLHKPVVTTDAPGMKEQFTDGKNGIIIKNFDAKEIAEGLLRLMDDEALINKIEDNLKCEVMDNRSELRKLDRILDS